MEAAEAAQTAGKRSWRREAIKAALLSAAMIGALGACWAGARYRHHVVAAYYGWRFARGDLSRLGLLDRLRGRRGSRDARNLLWRTAYELASDEDKKLWAACHYGKCAGARALYELVKRAGAGSPAEEALKECLVEEAHSAWTDPARYGFTSIELDETPPSITETKTAEIKKYLSFEFGSYRFSCDIDWFRHTAEDGRVVWRAHMSPLWAQHMERLPGPWRELPPAPPPPPPEEPAELESDYDLL